MRTGVSQNRMKVTSLREFSSDISYKKSLCIQNFTVDMAQLISSSRHLGIRAGFNLQLHLACFCPGKFTTIMIMA